MATSIGTIVLILVLEIVLRPVAFFTHDRSEYYLFYGLQSAAGRVGISPWTVYTGRHFKFPPNFELKGAAGQGDETAHTDSLGFRGADFPKAKPRGTFRIVALGGSSTFGFHDNDDGTYPFLLQRLYEENPGPMRVEVINAGFPYYNTGTIRGLLEDEIVSYEPDLITLYSAYNDVGWPVDLSFALRATIWIQQHSIIYLLAKESILTDNDVYRIKQRLVRKNHLRVDEDERRARMERVAKRYRDNVEAIADLAARRGIQLVLVRQPMTSAVDNSKPNTLTYEENYAAVNEKLERGKFLKPFERQILGHHRLIQEFDALAAERSLPVVDNVAIVDQNRNLLSSWVHLTEEANQLLAIALREKIDPFVEAAYEASQGAAADSSVSR